MTTKTTTPETVRLSRRYLLWAHQAVADDEGSDSPSSLIIAQAMRGHERRAWPCNGQARIDLDDVAGVRCELRNVARLWDGDTNPEVAGFPRTAARILRDVTPCSPRCARCCPSAAVVFVSWKTSRGCELTPARIDSLGRNRSKTHITLSPPCDSLGQHYSPRHDPVVTLCGITVPTQDQCWSDRWGANPHGMICARCNRHLARAK